MAVVITDCGFRCKTVKAHSPLVLDNKYKPNVITYEWNWNCQGAGDGSGGLVSATINFTDVHTEQYHTITYIGIINSNGDGINLRTLTDQWDNMYFPGHVNEDIDIYTAQNSEYMGIDHRDQLVKPLYLGRPRNEDGNAGEITIVFKTNTDTKNYNVIILGFTTQFPQPFSGMLQP